MRLINLTIPGGKRAICVDAALARLGSPAARHVAWLDVIEGRASLAEVVRPGDAVRLDAPGRCAATELALLRRGGYGGPPPEHGQLVAPAAWYAGYAAVLVDVAEQLAAAPPHAAVSDPAECAMMCDKLACADRLRAAGVPTPATVVVERATDVWRLGWQAAFVKLRHGSSGSGIVAVRWSPRGAVAAVTTVELDGGRAFNTRQLRHLRDADAVAAVVDRLCLIGAVAQPWVPKAGVAGGAFDLRLFVLSGRASHAVPRVSRSPITNLHLLNRRGDVAEVRRAVGEAAWRAAVGAAEAAGRCFPNSLHCGLDLAIDTRGRPWVLEVNAFGDLLPGLLDARGDDTHAAQLRHAFGRRMAA